MKKLLLLLTLTTFALPLFAIQLPDLGIDPDLYYEGFLIEEAIRVLEEMAAEEIAKGILEATELITQEVEKRDLILEQKENQITDLKIWNKVLAVSTVVATLGVIIALIAP